ncbi:MAG: SLC13 family permease, partial [Nitrospirota bacterium]|nr:SLC13 family permease [Nitrospirota bacterium]
MIKSYYLFSVMILLLSLPLHSEAAYAAGDDNMDVFHISGTVSDNHGEPVRDTVIRLFISGRPHEFIDNGRTHDEISTGADGSYHAAFSLRTDITGDADISLKFSRTCYKKTAVDLTVSDFARKGNNFYTAKDTGMTRILGPAFYISTIIFIAAYVLISFELLHRTLAAMLGAAIMLVITYTAGTLNHDYHIISFEQAIHAIDMNVIFLLMGMMIIVGILKHTGIFQWCAYKSFQLARGRIIVLSMILMTFTAISSAFLD